MELTCSGTESLAETARRIFEFGKENKIWLLRGNMGAGKTTFMHALAEVIGIVDQVNSPSYAIINEYLTREGKIIFHFDFFRIKSEAEALDTGFEEYLDSENYCFIEWPEMILKFIPQKHTSVTIQVLPDQSRLYKVEKYGC